MAVILGSARIDENGKASGGKAGDQTGKELSTQNWYNHSKGWRVLRAKDEKVAEYMAQAMESACANSKIGYDQSQNQTLYKEAAKVGFNPAKVTVACETDCARLVRVCIQYALEMCGINHTMQDFYTANMCDRILKTGYFDELKDSKSTYLKRGDILCTKTQGHTVIVLSNGSDVVVYKRGSKGSKVTEIQKRLLELGYKLPKYGADGDYGTETEKAVKQFQKDNGLEVDGECGKLTLAALDSAIQKEKKYSVVVKGLIERDAVIAIAALGNVGFAAEKVEE